MTRYGLIGIAPGEYVTTSGRYRVEYDVSYANECECIHCLDSRVWDCRSAVPGSRADKGWHVWDTDRGDYAEGSGYQQFPTLREAALFANESEKEES